MSKSLINQDAAYALGEEAFREGFHAGTRARDNGWSNMTIAEEHYWSEYEPSEEVKALISDNKPLTLLTSSGDTIQASYDPVTKIMFIQEIKV